MEINVTIGYGLLARPFHVPCIAIAVLELTTGVVPCSKRLYLITTLSAAP